MAIKRNTYQKKIILEEIKSRNHFFSAEDIHQSLSKKKINIGIATVYRLLKNLVLESKIHSYYCKGKLIYSIEKNNHCHFICKNCGEIKHIEIKDLNFIPKDIKEEVCHFQIDITGICNNCYKK